MFAKVCSCVIFYYGKMCNIKVAILLVLSEQVSGPKLVHVVVQPSPASVSRTFSSFQPETLNPADSSAPLPTRLSLWWWSTFYFWKFCPSRYVM